MDRVGYAPTPVDFQSTASTKLAYRPYEISLPCLVLGRPRLQKPQTLKTLF